MVIGSGRYDSWSEELLRLEGAEATLILVGGGPHGGDFAVNAKSRGGLLQIARALQKMDSEGVESPVCQSWAERVRASEGVAGVLVVVCGGTHGGGFAVVADAAGRALLPPAMRDIANQIERDVQRMGSAN